MTSEKIHWRRTWLSMAALVAVILASQAVAYADGPPSSEPDEAELTWVCQGTENAGTCTGSKMLEGATYSRISEFNAACADEQMYLLDTALEVGIAKVGCCHYTDGGAVYLHRTWYEWVSDTTSECGDPQ